MPLVSIIIPSYNSAKYVKEAVDSALSQTYPNIEVIVVDDGSTDNTKEVLSPYISSQKIKYIYQPNKGLSGARNTGIKASTGQYIALLDSDDIFLPEKIQKQVSFLEQNPQYDVCYCGIWHFYEEDPTHLLKLNYAYYSDDEVFPNLLKKNFINPLSTVFRRSVFDRWGYFDEVMRQYVEDWEFWLRIAYAGAKLHFLPEPLAKYRMRHTGIARDRSKEVLWKGIIVDMFKKLNSRMAKAERKKYKMRRLILMHEFKLFYANLSSRFWVFRKLHEWVQASKLKG